VSSSLIDQLSALQERVEIGLGGAGSALELVGDAVVDPRSDDLVAIADASARLREVCRGVDRDMLLVMARHAPVAGDLRLTMAIMDLARRGALISNQLGLIGEHLVELELGVPDRQQTADQVAIMSELAAHQLRSAIQAFCARDLRAARNVEWQDDAIDRINRQVFDAAAQLDAPADQRELAFRMVLIARCLERIGDNAVDIAEQVGFLTTGQMLEFTDASQPRQRSIVS
jgi:phosphate transport system protein